MPDIPLPELIGMVAATLLTIMVLSYLIGDNLFFRLAVYLFIGVAAGYAGAIALHNVLIPGLIDPLLAQGLTGILDPANILATIVPWLLVLVMLLKISPATTRFGGFPVALLVGVGAAVVVGGAITGTLIPQSKASMESVLPPPNASEDFLLALERMFNMIIMLIATLTTLFYFRFTYRRSPSGEARRTRIEEWVAIVGHGFIAATFGAMYAGAVAASIVVLAGRIQFLRDFVALFLSS